ncbi:MAG TPA: Crp/Fnr family transcriptional regulator [Anaerolineales bacterium]|nr:Crp/Fnr family transcriptional regulator [Anaerolineales bacterium]
MQPELLAKRLKSSEFFNQLDEESLAQLASQAKWQVFVPNAVVFWEGEEESHLFYLLYGSLKALKSSNDGREQVLKFVQPGDFFNEVGVFAQKPNPATVVALEESGIWLIPRSALESIITAQPHFAMRIIERMAERVITLADLVSDMTLKSVTVRFIELMLAQSQGDSIERRRWNNLTELAPRLGTVPDVLSRVVRELSKAGLIEIDRQKIRIKDWEGLKKRLL